MCTCQDHIIRDPDCSRPKKGNSPSCVYLRNPSPLLRRTFFFFFSFFFFLLRHLNEWLLTPRVFSFFFFLPLPLCAALPVVEVPMESSLVHNPLAAPPSLDDSLPQIQDSNAQQHRNLRIPPLRDAVPSRSITNPSPLEPNTTGAQERSNVSKAGFNAGNPPSELPTLEDFLHAARSKSFMDSSPESLLNPEPPPKTILPAFINLRAVEKLPYASFDEEVPRKRRRMDVHGDVFGEHLQLPVPQNQKEKKRPPFGPLTILNGLNEPPPNAAMFPPIEPDAIHQILTRPTRNTPTPPPIESIWVPEVENAEREGQRAEAEKQNAEINKPPETQSSEPKQGESSERKTGESDGEPPLPAANGGRPRKKLRKWTEEETNDLLRGVVKCGIGNWTTILAQPELKFNQRSAANLKDRFRVCCPWAYGWVTQVSTNLAILY